MAFYKTVIQVEVLTEGKYQWDDLGDVYYDILDGDASGHVSEVSQVKITKGELVKECAKHATDPEFFLGYD